MVPLSRLADAVAALGEEPWFVGGLWETPALSQWGDWGVREVRVLASPTGTFGAYGECEREVVQDETNPSGVAFTSTRCLRDASCEPRHFVRDVSIEDAQRAFADPRAWGVSHVYLRATASAEARRCAGDFLGVRLQNLAPYLSSAGSVTNLHWDATPGILAQTSGEKDVSLFVGGAMPKPTARRDSPCFRRSGEAGRVCPAGAAHQLRLRSGWGLFIPSFWAHHVTSLSAEALGAVWRLPAGKGA